MPSSCFEAKNASDLLVVFSSRGPLESITEAHKKWHFGGYSFTEFLIIFILNRR